MIYIKNGNRISIDEKAAQVAPKTTEDFAFISFIRDFLVLYGERRVLLIGLLGFFSGLPLLLIGSTLSFWLAQEKVDLTTIGLLSLTSLPYTFKFIWAPLVDRLPLPFITKILGRRRSWLFFSQLLIVTTLVMLSQINPQDDLEQLAVICLTLAFAAATQEIVLLTYQVERLGSSQYGAGEAMGIFGFRLGILLAGAGAFYMAAHFSWQQVYGIMAGISALGMLTTLIIVEPQFRKSPESELRETKAQEYLHQHPRIPSQLALFLGWFYGAVICPFTDFIRRKDWLLSLMILFLYKASDNLIGNMSNIFYAELGFSKIEIANASKIFGMWASIAGGFIGGFLITRFGMLKSLFYGCFLHGIALFSHLALYMAGYNPCMLYFTVGVEHLTGGMRLTALFAYQMTLCTSSYAATQLALCTSFVTLGRTLFSALSGFTAYHLGWPKFFALAAFFSLPSLALILLLAHRQQESLLKFKRASSQRL